MNESVKHKIDKIVEHGQSFPWKRRFDISNLDKSLIFHVVAYYLLIAKNGKEYIASSYASNIIDEDDQKNQSHAQLQELKYYKMCNAKKALNDFIQSHFKKQTGLFGHRGFFKFVDIKVYDGD